MKMVPSLCAVHVTRIFFFASLLAFVLIGLTGASQSSEAAASSPPVVRKPKRQLPVMTVERLKDFDGKNESLPLLLAIDRRVYDVSTKRDVYGPGGGYETFSGRDSTRNFALYSTESKDDGSCIDDLEEKDFQMLAEWRKWFDDHYPLVAVITEKLCEDDDSPEHTARRGFAIPANAAAKQQKAFHAPRPRQLPSMDL